MDCSIVLKRISWLAFLLALPAAAQTTSVTATLTDHDGVTWTNGSCTTTLIYKQQSPIVAPYLNAGGAVPLSPTCTVNGLGMLNAGLTDVAFIAPIFQATWQFTICPNVGPGSACGVTQIPVTGGSQDVSSLLNLPSPRVGGGVGATAYADVEVLNSFNNFYWNITSTQCRQYTTGWAACAAGSGSGSVTNFIAGSWPSWLAPSVSMSTTTPTLAVTASGIPNSALANNSITFGGASVALGSTATNAQQTITINSTPCQLAGTCTVSASGVPSVNTLAQPLALSFSAGAGSCSSSGGTQTCNFTGSSSGSGTVTNFTASSGGWPTWLVPTVATSTTTPALTVAASAIPNSALANSAVTIGTTPVNLGAATTAPVGLASVNSISLPTASGSATFTQTICSGTVSLGTAAIASGAAATTVTATCTGLLTSDNIQMDFSGSPLGVVGYQPSASGMLTIIKWPTANTINVAVANNTASAISPGAINLNYRVVR